MSYSLSCELLVFSLSRKVSFRSQVLLKSLSRDLGLIVKLLYLVQLSYDYQIVILSRYIQLFCTIALISSFATTRVVISPVYQFQVSIATSVSPYRLVSFILISLFSQICIFMPDLGGRIFNQQIQKQCIVLNTRADWLVKLRISCAFYL